MNYPFRLHRKKIIITPTLMGPKSSYMFNFILDTGASKTIIDENAIAFVGYENKNIKTENFVTAGGRVNGKIIKLQQIDLFGKSVSDFEVSIMKLPMQITLYADGLIGMDFLTQFKNFKIDFENNIIEI